MAPWARLITPHRSPGSANGCPQLSKQGYIQIFTYLSVCSMNTHTVHIYIQWLIYLFMFYRALFYPLAHFPRSDTLFARLPLAVVLSSANATDTTWLKSVLTHWHCLSWVYSNKQGSTTTHQISTVSRCTRTKQRANFLANFGYFF